MLSELDWNSNVIRTGLELVEPTSLTVGIEWEKASLVLDCLFVCLFFVY